jgi:Mor family transcriptional regulator
MVAGVRSLAAFQEHGVLTEEHVRATVAQLRDRPAAQNDVVGSQLDAILANLDRSMAEIREKGTVVNKGSGAFAKLLGGIEAFLDAGDAVRRRRRAERIYRDMVAERVSHERAAIELKKLNARQKGGWLGDDLRRLTLRVRNALTLSLPSLRRPAER